MSVAPPYLGADGQYHVIGGAVVPDPHAPAPTQSISPQPTPTATQTAPVASSSSGLPQGASLTDQYNRTIPGYYFQNGAWTKIGGTITSSPTQASAPTQSGISIDGKQAPASNTIYLDAHGSYYDASGKAITSAQADQARASGAQITYSSAAPTSLGSQVNAPTPQSGSFTTPNGVGASVADTFNASLSATIDAQMKQLQDSLSAQTASYQKKIDTLTSENTDMKQLESLGLSKEGSLVASETAAKQAALDLEQKQFTENYNARQALVGQLSTLLTTGQSLIEGMRGTTGLSSIMNPRIAQTMTDVQAQAGVISASLAAYDGQIGLAQNQLTSSLQAISSIYGDQLKYWDGVVNFYDSQVKENDAKIASLTSAQKSYIDAQINTIKEQLTTTQATADALQKAMLNPATALSYARAGVKLTDSLSTVATKVSNQAYADEVAKLNAEMASKGYSTSPGAGGTALVMKDSAGTSHTFYAAQKPGTSIGTGGSGSGGSGGAIVDGKLTTTQDHISTAKAQIKASASQGSEADGKYADPNVYLKYFTDWVTAGGTEKGFLKQFPYSTYINPSNTWLTDSMTQIVNKGGSGAQTP